MRALSFCAGWLEAPTDTLGWSRACFTLCEGTELSGSGPHPPPGLPGDENHVHKSQRISKISFPPVHEHSLLTGRPIDTQTQNHTKNYKVAPRARPMAAAQSRADLTEQSRSLSVLAARGSGPGAIPCGGRAAGEGAAPPGGVPPPSPHPLRPCRLTESVFQGRYAESDSGARRLGQRHH